MQYFPENIASEIVKYSHMCQHRDWDTFIYMANAKVDSKLL